MRRETVQLKTNTTNKFSKMFDKTRWANTKEGTHCGSTVFAHIVVASIC